MGLGHGLGYRDRMRAGGPRIEMVEQASRYTTGRPKGCRDAQSRRELQRQTSFLSRLGSLRLGGRGSVRPGRMADIRLQRLGFERRDDSLSLCTSHQWGVAGHLAYHDARWILLVVLAYSLRSRAARKRTPCSSSTDPYTRRPFP